MDGTRFDALTKRLATGTSRRRVLAGLGGALAGALDLGGAAIAADVTCDEALRLCQDRAKDTYAAAQRACQAGPREAQGACLAVALGRYAAATTACLVPYAGCTGTCKPDGELCRSNEECCSGRCGAIYADPRPVFGCK